MIKPIYWYIGQPEKISTLLSTNTIFEPPRGVEGGLLIVCVPTPIRQSLFL